MIKRLLKSVREFKKDALLTPFFVVLEVVMEVIIPMVMALLIDKGIDGQDMAAIWKYGRHLCGESLNRLCPQSASRYVLQCAEFLVFQH